MSETALPSHSRRSQHAVCCLTYGSDTLYRLKCWSRNDKRHHSPCLDLLFHRRTRHRPPCSGVLKEFSASFLVTRCQGAKIVGGGRDHRRADSREGGQEDREAFFMVKRCGGEDWRSWSGMPEGAYVREVVKKSEGPIYSRCSRKAEAWSESYRGPWRPISDVKHASQAMLDCALQSHDPVLPYPSRVRSGAS